jgi:hypothetical protein
MIDRVSRITGSVCSARNVQKYLDAVCANDYAFAFA